jgi:hypothetical protein
LITTDTIFRVAANRISLLIISNRRSQPIRILNLVLLQFLYQFVIVWLLIKFKTHYFAVYTLQQLRQLRRDLIYHLLGAAHLPNCSHLHLALANVRLILKPRQQAAIQHVNQHVDRAFDVIASRQRAALADVVG